MKKRSPSYFLLLLIFAFPQQISAEIYTWVDDAGRVHFTDTPPEKVNTKPVEISPLNTYNAPSADSIKDILARPTGAASPQGRVILYSTTWCGYCKKARRWLRQNNITFREYDTEKSERGRRDYQAMNGKSVPIIKIGKQRINGFRPSELTQLLRKAGHKI